MFLLFSWMKTPDMEDMAGVTLLSTKRYCTSALVFAVTAAGHLDTCALVFEDV